MKHLVAAAACILSAALFVPSVAMSAPRLPKSTRVDVRLWLGHDSNLLDMSDLERQSFETGDPNTFFAVDRMSDQFVQGALGVEWEAPKQLAGRPSLRVGWEHRQYLHNPIRSEDQLTARLQLRAAKNTRVEMQAGFRPQVYERHRFDLDAMPGEPRFRPEAYRRWDGDLEVRQTLDRQTSLEALLEGSTRRYRAPFDERDRKSFGGGGGLSRELGKKVTVRGAVRYRGTWTRNDPWDPDDRSHRTWRVISAISLDKLRVVKTISLRLDLEWRRFTSTNPDDQDHMGRRDQGGEAEVEFVRPVTKSLDWMNRATWRWRSSNFPAAVLDEEGVFEETVIRTGVTWTRKGS